MAAHSISAHLDAVSEVLTLVLHCQSHNALQEAETFSRLLCVNKQLRSTMLAAAVGRIAVSWPSSVITESKYRPMIQWLQQHMHLQTLKQLDLLPDVLDSPLHDYDAVVMHVVEVPERCKAFSTRAACLLGDAAALGAMHHWLPRVNAWCSHDLLPGSLCLLPGSHLTQLILSIPHLDAAAAQELAAITSLRELRLPLLNRGGAKLAMALACLTRLTGLLLVNPKQSVVDKIPASVRNLVLMRGTYPGNRSVRLGHLSGVQALQLGGLDMVRPETHPRLNQFEFGFADEIEGAPDDYGGVVAAQMVLPRQLTHLTAAAVRSAAPLLRLDGLQHLKLTNSPSQSVGDAIQELRSVTKLTRLELVQKWQWELDLYQLYKLRDTIKGLPLFVSDLWVGVPVAQQQAAHIRLIFGSGVSKAALSMLGSLTSLTRLDLYRKKARRAAAILTAAAAAGGNGVGDGAWQGTVQQLASALSQLTNLVELEMRQVPAVMEEGGVGAVGADWLPLTEAVAALPKLEALRVEAMPLGSSVRGLSAAQHLTSLALVNCQVDDGAFAAAVGSLACGSRLRSLTVAAPAPGPRLTGKVLPVLAQSLTGLKVLKLAGHDLTTADAVQLTQLQQLQQLQLQTAELGLANLGDLLSMSALGT